MEVDCITESRNLREVNVGNSEGRKWHREDKDTERGGIGVIKKRMKLKGRK